MCASTKDGGGDFHVHPGVVSKQCVGLHFGVSQSVSPISQSVDQWIDGNSRMFVARCMPAATSFGAMVIVSCLALSFECGLHNIFLKSQSCNTIYYNKLLLFQNVP